MNSAIDGPDKRPTPNTSAPSASTTSDPTSLVARRAGWLVLLGLVVYLTEFVGMAIAGGYPSNEPGTPLAQVPDAYAGLADGTGFLVGWMALVLTGRILIIIGLRAAVGASSLLDWAVTAMVVSVAVEVASVAAMAAAAGLVADGAALEAVLAADRIAWSLSAAVTAPAGLSVLLVAIGMWRSERFPRAARRRWRDRSRGPGQRAAFRALDLCRGQRAVARCAGLVGVGLVGGGPARPPGVAGARDQVGTGVGSTAPYRPPDVCRTPGRGHSGHRSGQPTLMGGTAGVGRWWCAARSGVPLRKEPP